MKSLAKSWKANPIIAVVIPSPATIDLTLIPNLANIATALYTTVDYLVGKNNSSEINCNYEQLKFLVARNATYLSQQEKLDIINILLNGSKEF